ncbi:sulfatase-like hydrolase/transferase [Paenibacillus sp.]|jgi:phosphoglycerol transferase MdoB-like AlkP superfamily enzyme|uniref:sulfatase-like hydrolase/transferase n=1 Tax=Paenibacillus sp. TaxID=58172 RepID=UPI002832CA92|nr:sulfatase-like hydrolase/transferase [Paenibacillus sp.]MDR0267686.1 sulfatase-like hydrolase/transferase [Paenibacillus sp.]
MSSLIVFFCISVLHIFCNIILNKNQSRKVLSVEQVCISLIVALLLLTVGQWNTVVAAIFVFILTLMYYINLLHVRFFGEIIPGFQMKQFLFSKKTASTNTAMLFQAVGRLVKFPDLVLLLALIGTISSLFLDLNGRFIISPLWQWGMLNALLLGLIFLTVAHNKRIRTGTLEVNTYGMLMSYFFIAVQERKKRMEQQKIIEELEAQKQENEQVQDIPIDDQWFAKWKGMNVILVQLESFQQFLLHHKVEGQEITPFLNRMAQGNMEFKDVFSQFAMGHTSDAELAALHSLYPLKNEIVYYKHYDKKFFGLPKILKKFGYKTAAFHGYKGDFYNRMTMMKTHGFEAFYSEDDYLATDRASSWLSDFSFFEQSVQKIKKMKQPFFSFMISLTSHFPFALEERHWGLKLSKEIPDFLASYYQSVNYTDRALEHFHSKLEEEGLVENTIFAFYGDHEGIPAEHLPLLFDELGLEQSDYSLKTANRLSVAKVPFIIASGDANRRLTLSSNKTGSTVDVGQTLLHLLGLPRITYGMGESLLSSSDNRTIPLTQFSLGSFVTSDTLCYASSTGDYLKSIIFDRENRRIILPESGANQNRFNYSKQQVIKSEHLIVNDLLVANDSDEEKAKMDTITFNPIIERILNFADDTAVILPISRELDKVYLEGQKNDIDSMKRLEGYYRSVRDKNIRFYSTFDLDTNDKPIYFADLAYKSILIEKGYEVGFLMPVPLDNFLKDLPDHVVIIASARDEASTQFIPEFAKEMRKFGFGQLTHEKYRHSYVNVVYKNKGYISLYEEVSTNPIEKHWEKSTFIKGIALPFDLKVTSKGALVGNESKIIINGSSYNKNLRGLNINVVDMETCEIIEVINVDTYTTTNIDNGMYKAQKRDDGKEESICT